MRPDHLGLHHLALNVRDVERSAVWYAEVLGFERVTAYRSDALSRVIIRHASGATIGLTRHNSEVAEDRFDERRAGLDHAAFGVADVDALSTWAEHFDALGVVHSEIKPGAIPGSSLLPFRDPDGLQLELYAPPPQPGA